MSEFSQQEINELIEILDRRYLRREPNSEIFLQGKVVDTSPVAGFGFCMVTVGGGSTPLPAKYVTSYGPTVNEQVLIRAKGTHLLITGRIS
jgi:hypothetical protein